MHSCASKNFLLVQWLPCVVTCLRLSVRLEQKVPAETAISFQADYHFSSEEIVFNSDSTFHRPKYPGYDGKWFARKDVLLMDWDGTFGGKAEMKTEDGGKTFSMSGMTLKTEVDSLPSWWASCFEEELATNSSSQAKDTVVTWSFKTALPENEGTNMDSFPTDFTSLSECKEWCNSQAACIGFAIELDSDIVKTWFPKKMATGFNPESAVWIPDKLGDGADFRFYWKTDEESLRRNDDGSSLLLRCPEGLVQHPKLSFQCMRPQSPDGTTFNKDGTFNVEEFYVKSFASIWTAISHSYARNEGTEVSSTAMNETANFIVELLQDQMDPTPLTTTGLHALGKLLTSAAHLLGSGSDCGVVAHAIGHTLLWGVKLAHGPLLPFTIWASYLYRMNEWHWRTATSQRKIGALYVKARCMQLITFSTSRLALKGAVAEHCGGPVADALLKQIVKTVTAMISMFASMEQVVWCMYRNDANLASNFGAHCGEEVLPLLKGINSRVGVVTAAAMITTSYEGQTTELFADQSSIDIFTNLYQSFLKTDFPELDNVEIASTLDGLVEADTSDRQLSCVSLLVTQQSYERMFNQLSEAFHTWLRTFGLDDAQRWSSTQCRDYYNVVDDVDKPTCKRVDQHPEQHSGHECNVAYINAF